ncbi:DUF5134 domain-containing protein [Pseudonocardia sp. DSM 110487]|uniref:DUF5134 domain-containing protein n=1 Tax=Pseudonocardia sp. DSM 110487 TaxID=2865833 RepID=UPI001C6A84C4|nr:DUF5134 domain-containing protein [Pseudonocardia sp. DSM 110487]QYN38342.1 DUF5134 domain-containing protein [Pseudonocardia sp. DSM 110487]
MFPTLAFTAIFTVTGLRSLARLVARPAGGDRTAELSHLLMSVAMVGMAWGWPAGTDTAGGLAQLVVFGVLAVVFVARLLDPAEQRPAGSAYQLLMLAAMVWMLLAMPSSHGHHGHGAAPALTRLVTVAFAVPLCAAAVALASRAPVLVPAAAPPGERRARRPDLAGHVLMSGGMAAMLLAML